MPRAIVIEVRFMDGEKARKICSDNSGDPNINVAQTAIKTFIEIFPSMINAVIGNKKLHGDVAEGVLVIYKPEEEKPGGA